MLREREICCCTKNQIFCSVWQIAVVWIVWLNWVRKSNMQRRLFYARLNWSKSVNRSQLYYFWPVYSMKRQNASSVYQCSRANYDTVTPLRLAIYWRLKLAAIQLAKLSIRYIFGLSTTFGKLPSFRITDYILGAVRISECLQFSVFCYKNLLLQTRVSTSTKK